MEATHTEGPGNGDKEELRPRFGFYRIGESKEKLKVVYDYLLLVKIDDVRSRNKIVCLQNESREYTLMDVSFGHLLEHSPKLVWVNKFNLISVDAIHTWKYDLITLRNIFPGWKDTQVVLARNYRKAFYHKIEMGA